MKTKFLWAILLTGIVLVLTAHAVRANDESLGSTLCPAVNKVSNGVINVARTIK